jgi:hypothetical protein
LNKLTLKEYGFAEWHEFSRVGENELLDKAPILFGDYCLAQQQPVPRIRGSSDILYFGSTMDSGGLQRRFWRYFHPEPHQSTNIRIINYVGARRDIMVSWTTVDDPTLARSLETYLLALYDLEHGELPPLNRRF